jgi:hypothetical protein
MRLFLTIVVLVGVASRGHAQGEPTKDESTAYNEAFTLLFDSDGRARKAISILLAGGKDASELTNRELSILCRAYNELHDSKSQLAAAKILWDRDSKYPDATIWMTNSLLSVYGYADDSKPLIEFVDNAISEGLGNRRELLLLKATAIIGKKTGLTEGQRRALATELLIEAFASGPPLQDSFSSKNFKFLDTPDFIDYAMPFQSFFSIAERQSLKVQMTKAREAREKVQTGK